MIGPFMSKSEIDKMNNEGRNYGKKNPFEGTEYADMWLNNPYKNLYYDSTFWDDIGLSNKSKDANAEYERLYNEYIAGIYDLQQQNAYNSESSKVQRMKDAGLNPDILGLNGSSESSDFTPPNAGPNSALNGQSPALNGFNIITQVLGFATSAMSSISQIKNLSSQTAGLDISNFGSLIKYAEPHITTEYARRFIGSEANDWLDVRDVSSMAFPSRKLRNQYKNAFDSLLSSSEFTAAENAYKQLTANDRAMKHFIGGIVDLELDSIKHGYKANIRSSKAKGYLENWRNEFYKKLYEDFKRGSDLAGLMIIASGNPTWSGIFGAGLNQTDRDVSSVVYNIGNFFNKKFSDLKY